MSQMGTVSHGRRQTPRSCHVESRNAGEDGRCAAENRGRALSRRNGVETEGLATADGFYPAHADYQDAIVPTRG